MLIRSICKYITILSILFLASCDCPTSTVPAAIDIINGTTGDYQGAQEAFANLVSTLYLNKVFGPKRDAEDGEKDYSRGVLRNRDYSKGIMFKMYSSIISSVEYRATYYLLFIMYIIVFGLKFLIGSTKLTIDSILPIIVRVALISMFTNPNVTGKSSMPVGWDYYYRFLIEPSLYAMEDFAMHFQAVLFGWDINKVYNGFLPLTVILKIFGEAATWHRMLSLILASPLPGFCCFLMIVYTSVMFILTAFFCFVTYVAILTVLAMLFAIGPFFMLLALFDKTRSYFMKWLMHIASFMLQQYTLFTVLSIFGFIVSQGIIAMLSFEVRCDSVIELTIGLPIPNFLKIIMPFLDLIKIKIPLMNFYVAALYGDSEFLTLFIYALFLYMLVQVFANMALSLVSAAAALVDGTYSPAGTNGQILKALNEQGKSYLHGAYGKIISSTFSASQNASESMMKKMMEGGKKSGGGGGGAPKKANDMKAKKDDGKRTDEGKRKDNTNKGEKEASDDKESHSESNASEGDGNDGEDTGNSGASGGESSGGDGGGDGGGSSS